jgi:hypothetical protein
VAGRYELLRELGSGGVGSVYLAQVRQTGEPVALKKLSRVDAKSVLRFKREFRSLANMQHPNLVRLYDLEREQDGIWFLTMEYVPGTDLVSHLRPPGAPAPDWHTDSARVLSSFRQLARGVSALHGAGMLHRDLKPSNVLVTDDRVLVLDFGLVRNIDERDARVTEEGMVSGTPAYMAPEQACAQPLHEAADWYAVGVMLYEVLAGELPFDGSLVQIMRQKVESEPTPIAQLEPDAPRALTDLCMALLRRDPSQRPSGAEILSRLGGTHPPVTRTTGETAASVARLEAQRALLPRELFTQLHVLHLVAVMYAGCATGKHAWALECVATHWQAFLDSPLRRAPVFRNLGHLAHARLFLNEGIRAGTSPASLREVMKDIKAMAATSTGQHIRLRARMAYLQGDHTRALALFMESAEMHTKLGWEPEASRDRYAIGRVTGGERGEEMAGAALDTLERAFGHHDARRDAQVYFPELAGSLGA